MQDLLVVACGVYFPDQGLNPGPLHWELRAPATGPPGKSPLLSFFGFYLTSSLIYPKSFIFFFLLECRANQFTQAPVCKPVHTNSTFCSVDEKGFICIRIHPAWITAGELSTTYFVLLRICQSKQLCACVCVCVYVYTYIHSTLCLQKSPP